MTQGAWTLRDWHWQLSPQSRGTNTAQPGGSSSNSSLSAAALELLWGSWCSGLLIHIPKSLYKWYPLAVLLVAPARPGIKQELAAAWSHGRPPCGAGLSWSSESLWCSCLAGGVTHPQSCQTTSHQCWTHLSCSSWERAMGKVNQDSLGNPQPTEFVEWAENFSKNPCHKEEQTQCCFTWQELSHLQTLQVHSCLNSPSLIVPFIQTYFVRLSRRWIKMHRWKEAPRRPQRLHGIYHLPADKSQSASL